MTPACFAARQQGVSYRTARKCFNTGTLPVPAVQTATGTFLVQGQKPDETGTAGAFARVCSSDQKGDLDG